VVPLLNVVRRSENPALRTAFASLSAYVMLRQAYQPTARLTATRTTPVPPRIVASIGTPVSIRYYNMYIM
jgi:hypothetical protein